MLLEAYMFINRPITKHMKALISILLCLSFSVSACDTTSTTTLPPTTTPVPNATADKYGVVPSSTSEQLPFSYTLFEDQPSPLVIVLPVKVEDYISESKDGKSFDMRKLASDYGWKEKDDYFYYENNDMWVRIDVNYGNDNTYRNLGNIVAGGLYSFVWAKDPDKNYYPFDPGFHSQTNNVEWHFYPREDGVPYEYSISLGEETHARWEHIVLFTYLFTYVSRDPQYNPFNYDEFHVRYLTIPEDAREALCLDMYSF